MMTWLKHHWVGIIVVVGLVILFSVIPRTKKDGVVTPQVEPIKKGVALTPKSFVGADFQNFFPEAKGIGSVVSWAGDWRELKQPRSAPHVVMSLAKQYDYTPLIQTALFTTKNGTSVPLVPLTDANLAEYQATLATFAQKYQPEYLGLGVEINRLAHHTPADFTRFADQFPTIVAAIKATSPNTQVFTVFQLENMKGHWDGLFGGKQEPAQWDLLPKFASVDLFAFTTYPGLIYKDPEEIPSLYYAEIASYTDKPVFFSEIGWPSSRAVSGWESSEAEQATFVATFFDRAKPVNPRFAIWTFLYDQLIEQPFTDYGLVTREGQPKAAYEVWKAAR